MVYSPKPFIATPTAESLATYVQQELQAIAQDLQETTALELRPVHAEPKKPREGMIVYADGTDWNPGNGIGSYVYQAGAWVWMGQQAQDLSGYLTKSDNLNSVASKSTARSNLSLVVGTDIQAFDAQLDSKIPQNSQSAAYTTVLTDGEKHLLHPASDNNARTFTIASNASVAYPIGTAITFVNEINTVTIAIASDTLTWFPSGSTGSRTLAASGMATALKITSTKWVISGVGLT